MRLTKLLVVIVALLVGCNSTKVEEHSGKEEDMAFWNRKKTQAPSTLGESLGAEFISLASLPLGVSFSSIVGDAALCEQIQVDESASAYTTVGENSAVGPESGFLLSEGYAISNDSVTSQVKFWHRVSLESTRSLTQIGKQIVHPAQEKWSDSSVLQAICLPESKSLLAIQYFDGGVATGRFLFDAITGQMRELGVIESDTREIDKYLFALKLPEDSVIVMHQQDKKRKSAEIYHNYYQYLTLYSNKHPEGLELLKLGIDDGNIQQWAYVDSVLYLQTLDNRDMKNIKEAYWSLDLSRISQK